MAPGTPSTQLRHSGLTHLAAQAAQRPSHRPSPVTGTLGTLGIYVQPGEETSARITAEYDKHARRRRR